MRWDKRYDGSKQSITDRSHCHHSQHPNVHTEQEQTWIRNYHRRNSNISICKLYGKLREEKVYSRHPGSLCRVFVRSGYRKAIESAKKEFKNNGHYDTPIKLGLKWQMNVKHIPKICYAGADDKKFFQYIMLEVASGKRFIYAYRENSSHSTLDFVKRAIVFFKYSPETIQTDKGGEFTFTKNNSNPVFRPALQ